MNRVAVSGLVLLLIPGCSNGVKLPIQTSIGALVRIEKKESVNTSDGVVQAGPQEQIYVLSFEGKKEITYEGKDELEGEKSISLVDSEGGVFTSVFAGTPGGDGTISNKDWILNGELKGRDGRWLFVGTMSMPEPRITLLYRVPADASGLALKDGEERHGIE